MGAAIEYRVEVFREGEQYVGLCPELNVSSFGETEDEAEASLREAVALFIEQCREMGTLSEVLEEAGFRRSAAPDERWVTRRPVKLSTAEIQMTFGNRATVPVGLTAPSPLPRRGS